MLEARLQPASVLKKILEAIKELVTDANLDCNDSGISLQSMDSSHVALVGLLLRANGFELYRCDRNLNLGVSLVSLNKILKCAGNEDIVTLRANENADVLQMVFEAPKMERYSDYELKLMDIDSEHLGIPDTQFDATVKMSSSEFQRICRDMSVLSDSMTIECNKEGVRFAAEGEVGKGSVTLKQGSAMDDGDEDDEGSPGLTIDLVQSCSLNFALKYLINFCKATPLSKSVTLCMSNNVPLLVEYKVDDIGYIRYYLAPKMEEE